MIGLPPILFCQLLHCDRLVGRGLLLHLVLVVLLADDLEVDLVLPRDIPLLLEQYCRIPANQIKQVLRILIEVIKLSEILVSQLPILKCLFSETFWRLLETALNHSSDI